MQARMRNPATLLTDAMNAILTLLKAASTPFFSYKLR
jgi:hypothetical protein